MPVRTRRSGFTFLELMIVVGIIAVLASILIPVAGRAREQARRTVCSANLRTLVAASLARATEVSSANGAFIPTESGGADSFAHLFPKFLTDYRVVICPSTQNGVRPNVMYGVPPLYPKPVIRDLAFAAENGQAPNGHSYETFVWYSDGIWADGTVINSAVVGRINSQRGLQPGDATYDPADPVATGVLKRVTKLIRPEKSILILDSDQDGSDPQKMNNWPEEWNNHGTAGINVGFCDGHVEWVPRGPALIRTYIDSYLNPAQPIEFTMENLPGLKIQTVTAHGRKLKKYTY